MSTTSIIILCFALSIALCIAAWAILDDYVYLGRGRTPRGERLCVACGHERGWHRTYRPTRSGVLDGCSHLVSGSTILECGCPAGRRSIR